MKLLRQKNFYLLCVFLSNINVIGFLQNDSFNDSHTKLKKLNSSTSINSQTSSKLSDSLSITTTLDNIMLIDGQIYLTPPNTPGNSSIDDQFMQYIIDASLHINMAVELEYNKKYEEAFTAYKAAIDILLKYGKGNCENLLFVHKS